MSGSLQTIDNTRWTIDNARGRVNYSNAAGKKGTFMSETNSSRRKFIANTTRGAVAAGLTMTAANWNNALGANDRVRLGVIGTGNRGGDVMSVFLKESDVEVVALCDCYDK